MHWMADFLERRRLVELDGYGVFALDDIERGALLCVWGGRVMTEARLQVAPIRQRIHAIQVEEGLYLAPRETLHDADYFNHSCEPNAGLSSAISLSALRLIEAGEEVCFDYAMSDGSPYDEFECYCSSLQCRGIVTGNDWKRPELQTRYHGYFSPYLARKIADEDRRRLIH